MKIIAIITKYAGTTGVFAVSGEVTETATMFQDSGRFPNYYHKPNWHLNKEDAHKQVTKVFESRKKSLERQLSALRDKEAEAHTVIDQTSLTYTAP